MNSTLSSVSVSRTRREQGAAFAAVVRYYRRRYELPCGAGNLYRLTKLGAWAASRAPHVFSFFRLMDLARYKLFIDLGSGDGIVTCIAGLFTRAVGIEVDSELCGLAQKAARDLKLVGRVDFICGDYRQLPIRRADCLYHYPDKPMYAIEEQLEGWQGDLLVYGPHFPLPSMTPVRRWACGRESLVVYRNT